MLATWVRKHRIFFGGPFEFCGPRPGKRSFEGWPGSGKVENSDNSRKIRSFAEYDEWNPLGFPIFLDSRPRACWAKIQKGRKRKHIPGINKVSFTNLVEIRRKLGGGGWGGERVVKFWGWGSGNHVYRVTGEGGLQQLLWKIDTQVWYTI